jgi:phosphopantothenoylcysteine decarboxylase/phosphopantothenate--cysteine ligase
MARILITSGPTRQFIDPVRYLTNASSGQMGQALAAAALAAGHEVVVVSGPVDIEYPDGCTVIDVVTTNEMLESAKREFEHCEGLIGVAAPCDYRPEVVKDQKISKTGEPLTLQLFETPDVVATLGVDKAHRWVVGFALETDDHHFRAITKLHRKRCDLIVLNEPSAMHSPHNQVEILDASGAVVLCTEGSKATVAEAIFQVIEDHLLSR